MYKLIKKILFQFDPEASHYFSLQALKLAHTLKFILPQQFVSLNPIKIGGLTFPNAVGLAAGFDKNGDYIDALATLGFGFIEVGTVTLQPQLGNPKPRIFRLPHDQAIINRLGFNNKGCEYLITKLKTKKFQGILGVNIGKGHATPLEMATDEYVALYKKVFLLASYVTINISSPNTKELRELQHGKLLENLLRQLKQTQYILHQQFNKYVPIFVKIAPDLHENELQQMTEIFLQEKIDGIIATNTTLSRNHLTDERANESGGLSGKPLCALSTHLIKKLKKILGDDIPIIASGGILTRKDAEEKRIAGAQLVQVYTGLIYSGPSLVKEICH